MDVTAELSDPATPALRLAHIAQAHPEHAAAIAQHPNAYPELVAWAHEVQAPIRPVVPAHAPVRLPQAPRYARIAWAVAAGLFIVPSFVTALVFTLVPGSYGFLSPEYGSGFELWIGSGQTRINVLVALMLLGFPAALVGAIGAPTAARRTWAIVTWFLALVLEFLPLFAGWVELPVPLAPQPLVTFAMPLVVVGLVSSMLMLTAWILSWPLSGRAFIVFGVLVVATALVWLLTPTFYGGIVGTLVNVFARLIVPVGIILLALRLSASAQRSSASSSASASLGAEGSSKTNTMAILSLVFAFFVSVLAVVFGHVALGQIRRTGESGRGMAIAGLVLGYIGLVAGAIVVIVWAVAFGALMSYRGY
jgi:peptidyl-prolyl cis-trans isomerase B (cyclophilin B)